MGRLSSLRIKVRTSDNSGACIAFFENQKTLRETALYPISQLDIATPCFLNAFQD